MAKDEMKQLEGKLQKGIPKRHAMTEMGGGPSQGGNGSGGGGGKKRQQAKKRKQSGR